MINIFEIGEKRHLQLCLRAFVENFIEIRRKGAEKIVGGVGHIPPF
jgi:hypothetical protein